MEISKILGLEKSFLALEAAAANHPEQQEHLQQAEGNIINNFLKYLVKTKDIQSSIILSYVDEFGTLPTQIGTLGTQIAQLQAQLNLVSQTILTDQEAVVTATQQVSANQAVINSVADFDNEGTIAAIQKIIDDLVAGLAVIIGDPDHTQEAVDALQKQITLYQGLLGSISDDLENSDSQGAINTLNQYILNVREDLAFHVLQDQLDLVAEDDAKIAAATKLLGVIQLYVDIHNNLVGKDYQGMLDYLNPALLAAEEKFQFDVLQDRQDLFEEDVRNIAAYQRELDRLQTAQENLQMAQAALAVSQAQLANDELQHTNLQTQISNLQSQLDILTQNLLPALNFFDSLTPDEQRIFNEFFELNIAA